MTRSYWRYIAAVVGWLALSGVVLFSLYPEQPHLTGNSGYQKEQSGYRAGGYDCQPAQIDKLPDTKRASRAVSCQEAEEQHRLQANDLIQQRRAADAADASAIFAFQQTWIGVFGAVVGVTTLIAAIAAAYYAKRAAVETSASVVVARSALDIANRTSVAQLRAYLDFDGVNFMRDETKDTTDKVWSGISIAVKNYGHTPAKSLTLRATYKVRMRNGELTPITDPPELLHFSMIAPQDHITSEGEFEIPKWLWESLLTNQTSMYVEIMVNYVDCFETAHELRCHFASKGLKTFPFVAGTRFST